MLKTLFSDCIRRFLFLIFAFLFLIFNSAYSLPSRNSALSGKKTVTTLSRKPAKRPGRVGEKIIYDVRLGGMRLGKAEFKYLPKEDLNGKKSVVMSFETRLVRFSDLEKIYSDPATMLPLKVERRISTWPSAERITEVYDQVNFLLTITKFRGNSKKAQVITIKKDNVINNAVLLPYFVRDKADLDIGYSFIARLPTQEFALELVAKEKINVPAGEFMAYRFVSKPRKFEVWISADERRIPVKIKGVSGVGYVLVMKEYSI